MDNSELKDEFNFYKKHQDELVKKYEGKYIVIHNDTIFGVFSSNEEAIREASKELELGTFLIQLVGKGEENYTQVFHTRVGYASTL